MTGEKRAFDPDGVRRAIVTIRLAVTESGRITIDEHRHRKSQLMLVERGSLDCEVAGGLWIVPPRSALWIPGGAAHAVSATAPLEGYNAFVEPEAGIRVPQHCCVVAVSPLLRELLVRASTLSVTDDETGAEARLAAVLLDEIAAARIESLHVPMPTDPHLRAILARSIDVPGERESLADAARRVGLGERTLARLAVRETGMTFGHWRRRLAVVLAVRRLAAGATIRDVAHELGYDSVPSFTAMFRTSTGISPGRYMTERFPRSGP